MKEAKDLVGNIVAVGGTNYLIDKVVMSDGANEGSSVNIQKFRVELITLDFLTPPIETVNKEVIECPKLIEKESLLNVKGFTFRISEELAHNKLNIVKAFKYVSGLGLKEAKDVVDTMKQMNNASCYLFNYEFSKDMLESFLCLAQVQALRIKWQDLMRKELQCDIPSLSLFIDNN